VLVGVIAALVASSVIHVEPSIVALIGAGVLVIISGLESVHYLASVEWETLLFFAGLFILVGSLVKTGVIADLARLAGDVTGGNPLFATMLILVVSAVLSGLIDNIPYVATMTPVVADLATTIPNPGHVQAMWWALAIGAGFGGNMTAVGASANVVMVGIAGREGYPIGFWHFTRKGAVVTALTVAVAAPYLWLRYFVLG
jgi:Na+/H+ antiporter NhaD/arsenite permease-like protein